MRSRYLKFVNFFYAKPLYIGSFKDCCDYNYEFTSKIPNWLGLPPLSKEYGENLAEGVIIKPMMELNILVPSGDDKKSQRAIVKLKHPLFFERVGNFKRKFKDEKKNNGNGGKEDMTLIHIENVLGMINNNRYQSVISKYGNPENDNHEFYVGKMVKDVFDDILYIEENKINEWWDTKVLKKANLLKYIQTKMEKKAMEIVVNNTKSN